MENTTDKWIPYDPPQFPEAEMLHRSAEFFAYMNKRRTVREFSSKSVPRRVIDHIILSASTAPSGTHKQPWTFCAVSSPAIKKQIREGAEKEEYENYHGRMPEDWLTELKKFRTDWHKPFLETAPWLIVVFRQNFEIVKGEKLKHYYVSESVGIATGFLLAAIHQAGLAALTHTPSPMNFLGEILQRPENEKPFLLIPVGYPADGVQVPDLKRKGIGEIAAFYE